VNGGGKIGITADVVSGNATTVTQLLYKKVPTHCSQTGGESFNAVISLNAPVNGNDRFKVDEDYAGGDGHLFFKGEFKRHARKVAGSFKDRFEFEGQDCNTGKRGYKAERGPLPNLPSGKRALRLAP
jgi:hypothetical protein